VKHTWLVPLLQASIVGADQQQVPLTRQNGNGHPETIYRVLKTIDRYEGVKKIYMTENGLNQQDVLVNGEVNDEGRLRMMQDHLGQIFRALNEKVKVGGYFVWSFSDSPGWLRSEHQRNGLVYVDFATQKRTVKSSGYWYKGFLGRELM